MPPSWSLLLLCCPLRRRHRREVEFYLQPVGLDCLDLDGLCEGGSADAHLCRVIACHGIGSGDGCKSDKSLAVQCSHLVIDTLSLGVVQLEVNGMAGRQAAGNTPDNQSR